MKNLIPAAFLILSCLIGTSEAGGLFSEDDATLIPDHRQPIHWASRDAGFSGYPEHDFAAPALIPAGGVPYRGSDFRAMWVGHNSLHNFKRG
ncbi:MAG: hypothetical protein VB835_20020, partial [Pirellulales bacterium]